MINADLTVSLDFEGHGWVLQFDFFVDSDEFYFLVY